MGKNYLGKKIRQLETAGAMCLEKILEKFKEFLNLKRIKFENFEEIRNICWCCGIER